MILFINTSQTDLIQLKLINNNQVVGEFESHENLRQSELLLGMIDKLIKSVKSVKSIAVVSGPGAFSALRLGVTTANTLAWGLKIPIVKLSVDEVQSDGKLIEVLKKKDLRPKTKNQFESVVPKYGREPNITQSKK